MEQNEKKGNSLTYILIAVVIALLGVSLYSITQKSKIEKENVQLTEVKIKLDKEIETLAAELALANGKITSMTTEMSLKQKDYEKQIYILKLKLKEADPAKLALLKQELTLLKNQIATYLAEIEKLRKQNAVLTVQRDSLQTTVYEVTEKATVLEKVNVDLTDKNKVLTKAMASLKAANIQVSTLKIKSNGKEKLKDKARKVKKIKLDFRIHQNNYAQTGDHEVYVLIMDAAGNVLGSKESGKFIQDGREMDFTKKTTLDFTNDNKDYSIEWINNQPFIPGDYNITLYADGHVMGKSKFKLR